MGLISIKNAYYSLATIEDSEKLPCLKEEQLQQYLKAGWFSKEPGYSEVSIIFWHV